MPVKLSAYLLIGILIFQITTLSVGIPIPTTSIGQVTATKELVARSVQLPSPVAAKFSAAQGGQEYDSIVFVGDIMLGRFVEQLMKREGDRYPFAGLPLNLLAPNPAIVANFEASIPEVHVPTPNYQLRFSVSQNTVSILREQGFTHFSLANNHSFDHDKDGYDHTRKVLGEDFVTFGSEEEVTEESLSYIETIAGTVAILGINVSNVSADPTIIADLLQTASRNSTLQVVYIHWGLEYEMRHTTGQKRLASMMVEQGADLIIGHHPHVVQDVDVINGVPVFYSLGNYIFDQYFSKEVQEGLVLSLETSPEALTVVLHPVTSLGTLSQPRLQDEKNRQQFLANLATRSHRDIAADVATGRISLALPFATSSKMAIISR